MTIAQVFFPSPNLAVITSGTQYNLSSQHPDEVTVVWNSADAAVKTMTIPPPRNAVVPNRIVIKDKFGNSGTLSITISVFGNLGTIEGVSSIIIAANKGSVVLQNDGQGNYVLISSNATGNGIIGAVMSTGQAIIAITGTAVQLPSNALINGVIITAHGSNSGSVTLGNSSVTNTLNGTGNGDELAAGASTSAAVANTNQIWVNGTAGDWVSFIGS